MRDFKRTLTPFLNILITRKLRSKQLFWEDESHWVQSRQSQSLHLYSEAHFRYTEFFSGSDKCGFRVNFDPCSGKRGRGRGGVEETRRGSPLSQSPYLRPSWVSSLSYPARQEFPSLSARRREPVSQGIFIRTVTIFPCTNCTFWQQFIG